MELANAPAVAIIGKDKDESRLLELGYRQDLRRGLNAVASFGMSFSVLSLLTAVSGSWGAAWYYGGPLAAIGGWVLTAVMTLAVGATMAEITAVYPTCGGLYYWSARLGGKRYGVVLSWLTAWLNLLGQIAALAGSCMAFATMLSVGVVMGTSPSRANRHGGLALASFAGLSPNAAGGPGPLLQPEPCPYDANFHLVTLHPWPVPDALGAAFGPEEVAFSVAECTRSPLVLSQPAVYGVFLTVLIAAAALNSLPSRVIGLALMVSVAWHLIGSAAIIVALPTIAPVHASGSMLGSFWSPGNLFPPVFGTLAVPPGRTIFQASAAGSFVASASVNAGGNGLTPVALGLPESSTNAYIFCVGLLMAQWCFIGYDANVHVSEETQEASVASPWAIVHAIAATACVGLAYILAILASVTDFNNSLGGPFAVSFNPLAQIFWDAFEARFGNGRWCIILWVFPIGAAFFAAAGVTMSASRALFAFSRDEGLPGSRWWSLIHPITSVPLHAVWCCAALAAALAAPATYSVEAFAAVVSVSTIATSMSYLIPIACRLTLARDTFRAASTFSLGRASLPIAGVALVWLVADCVFFSLQGTLPLDLTTNFNYASVAVGVVLVYSLATFFLPGPWPMNARRWFHGPKVQRASLRGFMRSLSSTSIPTAPTPASGDSVGDNLAPITTAATAPI